MIVASKEENERHPTKYSFCSKHSKEILVGQKKQLTKYVDKLGFKKLRSTNGAGIRKRKEDRRIMNFIHPLMNSEVIQSMDFAKWNRLRDRLELMLTPDLKL